MVLRRSAGGEQPKNRHNRLTIVAYTWATRS